MTTGPKFPADAPRSHAKLERAAVAIRRRLRLALTAPINWFEILAGLRRLRLRAGGAVYPLDYHVGQLVPGVEAETHLRTGFFGKPTLEIMLSNQTYAALEAGLPRPLFSLLHELGHATLHTEEVVRLSTIPHETAALLRGHYVDIPVYRDVEWQANGFAACCLMPAVVLEDLDSRGMLDVPTLCEQCGVSRESAGIRISVFRQRRRELMAVYS